LAAAALIVVGLLLPTGEQGSGEQSAEQSAREATVSPMDAHGADTFSAAPREISVDRQRVPATPATLTASAATGAGATGERAGAAPQTEVAAATTASDSTSDVASPPQRDRRKAPELRAAADLCTDFARLVDAQEMPALLERASHLLDSTGFIVWLADDQGHQLRPSLAHGYSPQALAKMPNIPRHADNATAAAFRPAEMQIVRTNGMSPGAIVTPILGPTGCVGVMAAEVRHGREASESSRALARIVAAQLATLIGSASAQDTQESAPAAEAGGARQTG
jgi:hypothetical protein